MCCVWVKEWRKKRMERKYLKHSFDESNKIRWHENNWYKQNFFWIKRIAAAAAITIEWLSTKKSEIQNESVTNHGFTHTQTSYEEILFSSKKKCVFRKFQKGYFLNYFEQAKTIKVQ